MAKCAEDKQAEEVDRTPRRHDEYTKIERKKRHLTYLVKYELILLKPLSLQGL